MGTNVARAQAHTAACFARGTVPAPYYMYLLMRAQRASAATASGCANPATAGGAAYVQRHTAQHKQCHRAPANHAVTPTATRAAWVTMQVPVTRTVRGVPVQKLVTVTNRKQVTVVA